MQLMLVTIRHVLKCCFDKTSSVSSEILKKSAVLKSFNNYEWVNSRIGLAFFKEMPNLKVFTAKVYKTYLLQHFMYENSEVYV